MASCQHCGMEFLPKKGSKGLYCSRSCRGKAACGKGEQGLRYKGGKIDVTCEHCGKTFQMFPSQAENSGAGKPRRFCSRSCTDSARSREGSQWWKGGRRIDSNGYMEIYMPGHPSAMATGYVHEHVLVAEMKHGGPLPEGAVVHHDDENRTNNDPENIIILYGGHSEHMALHQARRKAIRTTVS